MEKASKVMYSIANIFNWILLIASVALIVFSALAMANVYNPKLEGDVTLGVGTLIYAIILFIIAWVVIALVRKAKKSGTSKFWDILFIVIGVIEFNIFYFLGGLFGVIARRD